MLSTCTYRKCRARGIYVRAYGRRCWLCSRWLQRVEKAA